MSRSRLRGLLLVPVALLLMAATPLMDPPPVIAPTGLTAPEVHKVLRRTLLQRGWKIDSEKPAEIVATLIVREHSLTMRFTESPGSIAMQYVSSENLDYAVKKDGSRVIHRKYPGWCNNFARALSQNLDQALVEKT
jgi:hypothetical protein